MSEQVQGTQSSEGDPGLGAANKGNRSWFVSNSDALIPAARNIFVVLIAFAGVYVIVGIVLNRYTDSKDVTAVLGIVLNSINTIAAAAVGITLGNQVGSRAGAAEKRAAEAKAAAKIQGGKTALEQLDKLKSNLDAIRQPIEKNLSSAAGSSDYAIPFDEIDKYPALRDFKIPGEQLRTLSETLGQIGGTLQQIAQP